MSSIRRLVSQHPRSGPTADATEFPADALVLTPALRVLDGAGPKGPSKAAPVLVLGADDAVSEDRQLVETVTRVTTLDADEAASQYDWSEGLDDTPDAYAARHAEQMSLEERIAELEMAVGGLPGDFEPDGSEDLEQHRPTEVPQPEAQVFTFSRATMEPMETTGFSENGSDDFSEPASAQEGQNTSDDASPEFFETPMDAEAAADADDQDAAEFNFAGYENEGMLLDEEALREMISECIRDELQGVLGERITRNVRRLVRREVMRALTLKDLDT